jgi:hypothetical protein
MGTPQVVCGDKISKRYQSARGLPADRNIDQETIYTNIINTMLYEHILM